jgi:hypothetical protein
MAYHALVCYRCHHQIQIKPSTSWRFEFLSFWPFIIGGLIVVAMLSQFLGVFSVLLLLLCFYAGHRSYKKSIIEWVQKNPNGYSETAR